MKGQNTVIWGCPEGQSKKQTPPKGAVSTTAPRSGNHGPQQAMLKTHIPHLHGRQGEGGVRALGSCPVAHDKALV